MKNILIILMICGLGFSNSNALAQEKNKGKIFGFWGWNRSQYTNSDIHFWGNGYDFTLQNVIATDRQTPIGLIYIDPQQLTIPQYNAKIGYFFHDHWNVSIGTDHMKYVMKQNQLVTMDGNINIDNDFKGQYANHKQVLTEEFLTFEHTDGLNFANIEVNRFDHIYHLPLSKKTKKGIDFNVTEGLGIGVMIPKTNSKLMSKERNDAFHIAGWGMSASASLNITFYERFFIQAGVKGGYINMGDILTSPDASDKASQQFVYFQENILFGVIFPIKRY